MRLLDSARGTWPMQSSGGGGGGGGAPGGGGSFSATFGNTTITANGQGGPGGGGGGLTVQSGDTTVTAQGQGGPGGGSGSFGVQSGNTSVSGSGSVGDGGGAPPAGGGGGGSTPPTNNTTTTTTPTNGGNNAAGTTRKDPLTVFMFGLRIPDLSIDYSQGTAFFKSCTGLKREAEVTDYQEGGINTFTRKVIGVTKWPSLVLKQGFTGDNALWAWRETPFRVNGTIIMLGPNLEVKAQWEFKNGYPVKWEGPELDASKNELAIETIEIAHEGLTLL